MFDYHIIAGYLSGFFEFIGSFPYAYAIIKRKTIPSRTTWFIWSLAGTILFFSYFASGARETLWQPAVAVLFNIFFALISLKYGTGGTTKLDIFCFAGAIFSAVGWCLTSNPVLAVTFISIIGLIGAVPTIVKVYHHPETENFLVWALWAISGLFNVIALKTWNFSLGFYPAQCMFIGWTIFLLTARQIFNKKQYEI